MSDQMHRPAHLRDDALFATCCLCHRRSYDRTTWGTVCGSPQPDGSACVGYFSACVQDRALAVALDAWLDHVHPESWTERQLLTAGFVAGWAQAQMAHAVVAYEQAKERTRRAMGDRR